MSRPYSLANPLCFVTYIIAVVFDSEHTSALRSNLGSVMSGRASIPAKDVTGTKAALDDLTRRILAVPHSRIKAALEAEKQAKRTRSKRAVSRASVSSPKRAT